MSVWLDEEQWESVQSSVPIACVDVLCLRSRTLPPPEVGLILRDTPDGDQAWGLIGGRVLLDEPLSDALERHIRSALGPDVVPDLPPASQPLWLAEYRPTGGDGFLIDPRKHAIGITYAVAIDGEPHPQGEAHDFRWFAVDELPEADETAFGQRAVVDSMLSRLGGP